MNALAILGMMITGVFFAVLLAVLTVGPVSKEKTRFACCTVSASMSLDKFC
jgi:hypothetical protein